MPTNINQIASTTFYLPSAVVDTGTVDVPYPVGKSQSSYVGGRAGTGHYVILDDNNKFTGVALSFGASNVTVTNNTGVTWAAGSKIVIGMDEADGNDIVILPIPVKLAKITGAGDVVTEISPNLVGSIVYWEALVTDPVTTAAKAATLNLEIGTTNVTGGALALTSAAVTPLGKVIAGAAITGNNQLTRESKLSIEAASVTAFSEGEILVLIHIRRNILADAY